MPHFRCSSRLFSMISKKFNYKEGETKNDKICCILRILFYLENARLPSNFFPKHNEKKLLIKTHISKICPKLPGKCWENACKAVIRVEEGR